MLLKLIKNVQIQSACIWASAILLCSFITGDSNVATVLITAAGFHVVLMSQHFQVRK